MVIGFKQQFVTPILAGTKIHTIREDKGNRWKAGMLMHLYTGGRFSKEYHQFAGKQCLSVQRIQLYGKEIEKDTYEMCIKIDGIEIPDFMYNKLSIADGFIDWLDFQRWWVPVVAKCENRCFEGKIIHWTDFKY